MANTSDHIILPVSALKSEVNRVFDALAAGRTVFVSRFGDVVAAFQPDVPTEIAAAYALPHVDTAELSSRAMHQASPTRAVNEAVGGLPSLVTRDHKVYGMLVAAKLPVHAASSPDVEALEARSEAMTEFLTRNPNAAIEDIVAHRKQLDSVAGGSRTEGAGVPDSPITVTEDQIDISLQSWRNRGSIVEATTARFLLGSDEPTTQQQMPVPGVPIDGPYFVSVAHRKADQLIGTDPVGARTVYVEALAASSDPGLMWRLGDLTRQEGLTDEASKWYQLAIGPRSLRPARVVQKDSSASSTTRSRPPKPSPKAPSELLLVEGLTPRYAAILHDLGVDSIQKLAKQEPAGLARKIKRRGKARGIPPNLLFALVQGARKLQAEGTHRRKQVEPPRTETTRPRRPVTRSVRSR